ncbi:MAG: hypothetical protein MR672_06345 [Oscillibacter sp.]|nr:hypothetical protein [Oscillibacter sp.]MDY4908563.1 hypothetical protein [Oscillospiraceae bacterium]
MNAATVSARFAELFPESNLIGLLSRYGGDADDIFEAIQDQYDAHEQEPLAGLLGIKPANLDDFARAAYWELIDEIRVRYLSSLTRGEAAAIAAASGGCIAHPENDDIDWSTDEFIDDWNALHRSEEAIAR